MIWIFNFLKNEFIFSKLQKMSFFVLLTSRILTNGAESCIMRNQRSEEDYKYESTKECRKCTSCTRR